MTSSLPTLSRARAVSLALLLSLTAGPRLFAAITTSTGGSQPLPLGQPVLGLRYMIATQGLFPTRGGSGTSAGDATMLGEIRLFAFPPGGGAPGGWADCNGQLVPISSNPALFSLLGTYYGGNGTTTFGLPDLRGRIVVGQGSSAGSGLTPRSFGELFGSPSVNLSVNNLASHRHTMAGGAQTGFTGGGTPFPLWRPSLAISPLISPLFVDYSYLSEVRLFAGNFEPDTWVYADGRTLLIGSNTALYSKIGTYYGGNGTTNFKLPALPGRTAFGEGQAPGQSNYVIGEWDGAETQTMITSQMPGHIHSTAAGATGVSGGSIPFSRLQPTLTMEYMIAVFGIYPSGGFNGTTLPTIGEIRPYAGTTPPADFMLCQGQLIPIAENETLFSLIGTLYGGDGQTTFALPDLRGRVPAGIGSGPGLPTLSIGETQGNETAVMTVAQIPTHFHTQPAPALTVRGNGVTIVNGDTTPSLADYTEFTPVDVAAGATTRSFSVSNGGLGDLTLFTASLSGNAAFTVLAPPAGVVAPGGSTTLQLSFDPSAQGSFTATAQLATDDPGNASFSFMVGGNGANNLAARYPGVVGTASLLAKKNTGNAALVDLSWGAACGPGATGYAVYEGQLGNFSSHALVNGLCNMSATTAAALAPAAGNRYYLVSAIDGLALEEGSLGKNTAGVEYTHPAGACEVATDLTSCP